MIFALNLSTNDLSNPWGSNNIICSRPKEPSLESSSKLFSRANLQNTLSSIAMPILSQRFLARTFNTWIGVLSPIDNPPSGSMSYSLITILLNPSGEIRSMNSESTITVCFKPSILSSSLLLIVKSLSSHLKTAETSHPGVAPCFSQSLRWR